MLITTEQAKQHLKLNTSLDEKNFSPFIPDAERKYIRPFLGDTLFNLLNTWAVEQDAEESPEMAALYPYVVAALSRFTLLIAVPHLNVHVGESGFGVVENNNIAPASKERVADFKRSTEQLAWDNIEEMLRFLELHKDDYEEWVLSEAFTLQTKNLINSAVDFHKHVDIDESRLTFHRLRQEMTNIEDRFVKPLISDEQFDTFIEMLRDEETFTAIQKKVLTHLQGFVANMAASGKLDRDTRDVAEFHLVEARSLLNKYPEEFPDFALSEQYSGATKPFVGYENTDDSGIFSAIM